MTHRTQGALARAVLCLLFVVSCHWVYAGGFGPAQGQGRPTVDGTTPVAGPSSSVDSYVSVFSGTTGKLLDDRPVKVASTGQVSWPTGLGAITHISGPTDQNLTLEAPASRAVSIRSGGASRWAFDQSGHLRPLTDAVYDIGASTFRARYVYAAGGTVPSVLHKSVTSASTTGTSKETLWSYVLPAGTLASDGQGVRVHAWGDCAGNTNAKIMSFEINGVQLRDMSTTTASAKWSFDVVILRSGASAQVYDASGSTVTAWSGTTVTAWSGTGSQDNSSAITIQVDATTASGAGDSTFRAAIVEFLP